MASSPTPHDDPLAQEVGRFLGEALGCVPTRIPESPEHRSPDLLLEGDDATWLVEVTARTDDEQFREIVEGESGIPTPYSVRRLRQVLDEKWRQIRDFPGRTSDHSTAIWLDAASRGPEGVLTPSGIATSLWGSQHLEVRTEDGRYDAGSCGFFHDSAFFRWKQLDLVFVHGVGQSTAHFNPFSPRAGSRTHVRMRSALDAYDDVEIRDVRGLKWVADFDADRGDTNEVVRRLEEKYRWQDTTVVRFGLVVPPPSDEAI